MLLLIFFIIFGIILLGLASKDFYILANKGDPSEVAKVAGWGGAAYVLLALLFFILAAIMFFNNTTQYTVEFSKLTK